MASTPDIQTKRYTAAAGTLTAQYAVRGWYYSRAPKVLEFTIWAEDVFGRKYPVTRTLKKYETINEDGELVDSPSWTDSIVKGIFGKEHIVSPWTVWKKGHCDVDEVQVIAAKDGKGKWTLAPLPKAELETLANKRRVEEQKRRETQEAERKALKEQEAQLKIQTRLMREKRAQEAKAQMASVDMTSGPSKPLAATRQPVARMPVSRGSPPVSSIVPRCSSPRPSPRTSSSAGNRRSSVHSIEKPKVSRSQRSSVASSGE